jgi:anti-sigma B factor antagonist
MTVGPNTQGPSDTGRATFAVDTLAGCAVVSAVGEIDLYTTYGLHGAVNAALRLSPSVIIDMHAVAFIDSTGLGVLIAARKRAKALGGSVSLVAPPASVRRILTSTQLQQTFAVFDTPNEAVRAVRPVRTA